MIKLTEQGLYTVKQYIRELEAKRKEVFDAGLDDRESDSTNIPDVQCIIEDIEYFGDEEEYYNNWGVTDNYNSDYPLHLVKGADYQLLRPIESGACKSELHK